MAYVEAIQRQIAHFGPLLSDCGYVPTLMYWGGGTASILTTSESEKIMASLDTWFDLSQLEEATIESSPESVSADKLRAFRKQGFSRISIGVQTFNDLRLRRIGRAHSARQALDSVHMARDAGFDAINVDLITGFPGESLDEVKATLIAALHLPATHFSIYPYRPARNTVMRRQLEAGYVGPIVLQEQLAAYLLSARVMERNGFPEYALGHFGQQPCRTDMAYFRLEMDWIGFGSGATSLFDHYHRATTRGLLHRYIANPTAFDEELPVAGGPMATRLIYQSLSTFEGLNARDWEARSGVPLASTLELPEVRAMLDTLQRSGRLHADGSGVWFEREDIARSFIHLQYLSAPDASKRAVV
jgi:coproporphyrinogen III oxidase-like Fe-S oxidoreductase